MSDISQLQKDDLESIVKQRLDLSKYSEVPIPFRLVMIKAHGVCQFCEIPEGESNICEINYNERLGFISCNRNECINKMKQRKNELLREIGFTKLISISNNLKVKRTSGIIDENWQTKVEYGPSYRDLVWYVYVYKENISKFVKINELIELNGL